MTDVHVNSSAMSAAATVEELVKAGEYSVGLDGRVCPSTPNKTLQIAPLYHYLSLHRLLAKMTCDSVTVTAWGYSTAANLGFFKKKVLGFTFLKSF